MSVRMTVFGWCCNPACEWSTEAPGSEWDKVSRAAEKHLAAGHPVSVVAIPATERKPAHG